MTIEYEERIYRDDRIFVMNLSYGRYIEKHGPFSRPIEDKDAWILRTYRNTVELPVVNTHTFDSSEDARAYIVKIEHTTPLISRKGNLLEIPKKIDIVPDRIRESERSWYFYNRWLSNHNLFGAISHGFPTKHKQHCSYIYSSRGYTSEHVKTTYTIYVDGVEEWFYENGNIRSKTKYVQGFKHGPAVDYYENGQIRIECAFKNDEEHGSYESFHENGQLRSKGQLNEGEQIGYWEWFDEDGKLTKKGTFENGELNKE